MLPREMFLNYLQAIKIAATKGNFKFTIKNTVFIYKISLVETSDKKCKIKQKVNFRKKLLKYTTKQSRHIVKNI